MLTSPRPFRVMAKETCFKYVTLCFLFLYVFPVTSFGQQPANNDCGNASSVNIPNGGFGLGVFSSDTFDLSNATVQPGESFAPAILVAGQNQKSIWYKFTVPTTRQVRVTLAQTGTAITVGDAGFAVYKTNTCLPTDAQISTKLTPIGVFGNTFHPCVESGDYYVQVSGKAAANGPVYLTVELLATTALYDNQANPYEFGTLASPVFSKYIDYEVECQSLANAAEVCPSLANYQQYNKSTWHTFTTPAYFDYLAVWFSATGVPAYFDNQYVNRTVGYNLYQGDSKTLPLSSLTLVDGCDSFYTSGYYPDKKVYKCGQLLPNTTYTVQLFFREDFKNPVRVSLSYEGTAPTQAPEPVLSLVPASNQLGTLPADANGVTTYGYDQLACNARHSLHPCNPSLPAGGVQHNGLTYNLSTFFTFTLSSTSRLYISESYTYPPYRHYNSYLLMRLFKQDLTNNCGSLDTANLYVPPFLNNSGYLDCVPPGTYTLQVLGRDSLVPANYFNYSHITYVNYLQGLLSDLGKKFYVGINVATRKASNNYNLAMPGAFDTLNNVSGVMTPLTPGINYQSKVDTFGCANTVRPADTTCYTNNNKVSYKEFAVADSGIVTFSLSAGYYTQYMKLYNGDANALAISQSAFNYPSRIAGLDPYTTCLSYTECAGTKGCVIPGTYTFAVFGHETLIGGTNTANVKFDTTRTIHNSPEKAENMGDILSQVPAGGSVTSTLDYYDCKDNAVAINGYQPCTINNKPATKAIYRQFYLSSPAIVDIYGSHFSPVYCGFYSSSGKLTLFSGKATDGIAGLSVMTPAWQCFENAGTGGSPPCSYNYLPAGWYTVVSYGSGPSYDNPLRDLNEYRYSSYVGHTSKITIQITVPQVCTAPQYNRPYKAAINTVTGLPFLVEWGPRVGHTAAYPKTDTTYILPTENFNCTNDTPFVNHPIPNCASTANPPLTKVAYWVFRTTQESFVQINTNGLWGVVYAGNARTDSASFASASPVQSCLAGYGHIQLCKLQPGTYTLAVFAPSNYTCHTITPTVYIDQVGYSRFDHANNAYDFGTIPGDSVFYSGKPGDINPLNAGRAASNDFFYCTTGSQQNDPAESACYAEWLPSIYNTGVNNPMYTTSSYVNWPNIPRRNLWYTFVADKGGYVRIKVNNKTPGKTKQYLYAVYKSNVNGSLSFSDVVAAGQVDSTASQGLTYITGNRGYWCLGSEEISFYRDPCSATPERYYIVVDIPSGYYNYGPSEMQPNHQAEVSVLIDTVNFPAPKFDHYYQASNIGSNLGTGTYTGATDNYSCATRDATDPVGGYYYCANKTLWYKFSTNVTGNIRYRIKINNSYQYGSGHDQVQLYRQIIPGDSTVNGLQYLSNVVHAYDYTAQTYWYETCVSPGTYYLVLPGCNRLNEYVFPEIQITEQIGDFCGKPALASLNGAGTNIASVLVDCHTIGTDYGEFNPTLTCPNGATTTQYKTSWFRIDITGADTLDVTTYLTENTNAASTDIKYRLMNGDCSAMQERSCVQDALTQDTYKCLAPGSYWVQVFTPVIKNGYPVTGTISLNLSAVVHADTCAPLNSCFANAYFQKQFDCTVDEAVRFVNYSTFGSSISYHWDFGYNGQTSTAVSPRFEYPALLTSQKYYITLTVTNNNCNGSATYLDSIVIPPRPGVNLGPDVSLCNGGNLVLDATSHPGSTYQWHNGSTSQTFAVTATGQYDYWVKVTYNGCIAKDTIRVNIDPINPQKLYKYICGGDPAVLSVSRGLGESYQWSTGASSSSISVYNTGSYWCDISLNGCITRDSFIVAAAVYPLGNDRQACFGQPVVLNATTQGATAYAWQNGSTNATYNATAAGLYWVDISFGSCTLRDTIVLNALQPVFVQTNSAICAGNTYTLPSGNIVSAAGIYKDTIRTAGGCDSLITDVTLGVQAPAMQQFNPAICPGQTYTLPWGAVVNAQGIYRDTLYYTTGCDSVRRVVNLTVQEPAVQVSNPTICQGQTYTLPWGTVVNTQGIYRDTLHYTSGCDSIHREINLTVQQPVSQVLNPVICQGENYTLPWGTVVNTQGTYRDTLYYTSGCDSMRREINLTVQQVVTQVFNPNICQGQTYTLPGGIVVNTQGTYRDTLYYTTGCDSIHRVINLTVQQPAELLFNPIICQGQTYTLPWGTIVNVQGIYRDTLHYTTGCDSVRREVNLTVQQPATQTFTAIICQGQNYTLPWGTIVNTQGVYRDTLHYTTGCDSIRREITLTVQQPAVQVSNPIICQGQVYTLPWGLIVNTQGIYRDTLHYTTGCDSVHREVNLTVQQPTVQVISPNICQGQTYTLPWGLTVNTQGTYRDTLHYTTGCDSVRREVTLTVQQPASEVFNPIVCEGQTYMLPWGPAVNTQGTYRDTLHYTTGCDSVYRIVNLTVQQPAAQVFNPIICHGQTYTLPWGLIVNSQGIYRDTLHYTTGCDSVRRVVNLTVQQPAAQVFNPIICQGQTYTLPWGLTVNSQGIYRDTLHYTSGCDSIHRQVNLIVQQSIEQVSNPIICYDQTYTLPWGTIVNSTGTYRDTLHYVTGCDSIIRIIHLKVQTPVSQILNPVICQGATYTLPWGTIVNSAGIYSDTLYYTTGCDSVWRTVNLQVTPAAKSDVSAVICSDETYTLPWGTITRTAGMYRDTVRTVMGCDSLIRTVSLKVNPAPIVSINKSNDVDCMLGIAKLEASGGGRYVWTPATSLNNSTVYNPVASPPATTWYKVLVTSDKGCTTADSIQVKVITGDIQNGYLVPNAFTPNGDGRNDCFGVQTWGAVTDFEFSIYNRWGERIFYTRDPKQCWDGRYKGAEQSSNVFVYQITAKGFCGQIYRKGTFTLIR